MKQKFTLVLIITAFCFLKINSLNAQVNTQDSLALVDLYNNTNGPGWRNHTNWLTGAPVASWYGVYLNSGRVIELYLEGNYLNGILPSSIGNLTGLENLTLNANFISGSIPFSIGNLINLKYLFLDDNQFAGSIPTSFGNLINLAYTNLGVNKLTGKIPSSLGNLINIKVLELYENKLSGAIPSSFSKLIKLRSLLLVDNQLTGNIAFLGKLDSLEDVELQYNQLSGNIPTFHKCSNLFSLWINNNLLSGTIHHQFDSLSSTVSLSLSNNRLTGSIPLNQLAHLNAVDLSYNKFNGTLLPASNSQKNIQYLYLNNNQLSGIVPSLANLKNIYYLALDSNQFTFSGMENIATTFPFAVYSPQANIPITQSGNLLSVNAGGTTTNNTYKWYRNGKPYRTKTGNATLTASNDGAYTVEVTNAVATKLTLYGDTVNYAAFNNTVAAATTNRVKPAYIYPNPATTTANVYFTASGKYTITVTDFSGKILQTKEGFATANQNLIQLSVSNYASGLYIITINDEKNNTQTLRLNKQ